jgi:hypothetical protein
MGQTAVRPTIGIMQGRLSRPTRGRLQSAPVNWTREFPVARAIGFDAIEWVWEGAVFNSGRINQMAFDNGVAVKSICADWFLDGANLSQEHVARLDEAAREIHVEHIVIPLFGESFNHRNLAMCEDLHKVQHHIETEVNDPGPLLRRHGLKLCYDTGERNHIDPDEIFELSDLIGSVHVKDKYQGVSVPLGSGDADFHKVFLNLFGISYPGLFVIQAARGAPGEEIPTSMVQYQFVRQQWEQAFVFNQS